MLVVEVFRHGTDRMHSKSVINASVPYRASLNPTQVKKQMKAQLNHSEHKSVMGNTVREGKALNHTLLSLSGRFWSG